MTFSLTTQSEEETRALGERLGALLLGGAVVLLDGSLGSGKTRFAQGVAKGLGVSAFITSPTFNLVLEYPLSRPEEDSSCRVCSDLSDFEKSESGCFFETGCLPAAKQSSSEESKSSSERKSLKSLQTRQELSILCQPTLLRHFDLYRLERPEQLDDLDYFGLIEEYDAVSLVEWGSKFTTFLPLDYILVGIALDEDDPDKRRIEFSAEGALSQGLLEQFTLAEGLERMQPSD